MLHSARCPYAFPNLWHARAEWFNYMGKQHEHVLAYQRNDPLEHCCCRVEPCRQSMCMRLQHQLHAKCVSACGAMQATHCIEKGHRAGWLGCTNKVATGCTRN